MKTWHKILAMLLVVGIGAEVNAQITTPNLPTPGVTSSAAPATPTAPTGGMAALSGETLDQLSQLLQDGNLIALFSDMSLAQALGLDVEQWMLAGFLIEQYQNAVLYYWSIDPQGQDPETWQSLAVIRTLTELALFQLLTPAQQQQLEQIYQQLPAAQGTAATGGAATTAGATAVRPSK